MCIFKIMPILWDLQTITPKPPTFWTAGVVLGTYWWQHFHQVCKESMALLSTWWPWPLTSFPMRGGTCWGLYSVLSSGVMCFPTFHHFSSQQYTQTQPGHVEAAQGPHAIHNDKSQPRTFCFNSTFSSLNFSTFCRRSVTSSFSASTSAVSGPLEPRCWRRKLQTSVKDLFYWYMLPQHT